MAALDTFIALRDYVKGKINDYELVRSDELIDSVREDRTNRGQSEIRVEFDGEAYFLEAMGLREDDIWFYQVINSPYDNYEFLDSSYVYEDFENGYGVFYEFDDENKEKLSQISKLILPKKIDFEDEEYKKALAEKLLTNFKSETEDILDDYESEKNYEMTKTAREVINKELEEYLNRFGFDVYGNGFKTTVGDLISVYIKENAIHYTLKELIEKLGEDASEYAPGGWYDNSYEFQNDENFDGKSFNSYVSYILDKILEKLENSEEGATIEDYTQMTDRITKKFKQGEYYYLPKDPKKETRFKIEGFEYPNMKVVATLQKGMKQRQVKLSEENFFNLLYMPSLFNLDEV